MEQQYAPGVPATQLAQAARTVLPGEPFEAPSASAVPGPRPADHAQQQPQQPYAQAAPAGYVPAPGYPAAAPVAYEPAQAAYGAQATYVTSPATGPGEAYGAPYPTAAAQQPMQQTIHQPMQQPAGGPSPYETLQEYAALPTTAAQAPAAPAQPQYQPQPSAYPTGGSPAGHPGFGESGFAQPTYGQQPAQPAAFAAASWPEATPAAAQAFAPAQVFPTAPQQPTAGSPTGYPQAWPVTTTLPSLLPEADEDEPKGKGRRRAGRSDRSNRADRADRPGQSRGSGPNRALVGLAVAAVLGGGGYFGYKQWVAKSDTAAASTPAAASPAARPPYSFPNQVASVTRQTSPAAQAQVKRARALAMKTYPTFAGSLSVASYGVSDPAIVVETFRPSSAVKLDAAYKALLATARKPAAAGNVVLPAVSVSPGAAGGRMTCVGQRGAAAVSYCVWRGSNTVGLLSVSGTPTMTNTQTLVREMRAYAEH